MKVTVFALPDTVRTLKSAVQLDIGTNSFTTAIRASPRNSWTNLIEIVTEDTKCYVWCSGVLIV